MEIAHYAKNQIFIWNKIDPFNDRPLQSAMCMHNITKEFPDESEWIRWIVHSHSAIDGRAFSIGI